MFLVIGLVGGNAGALGGPRPGKGKADAPGQVKKHGAPASAGGAAASASGPDCGAYCSTSDGTPSGNGNGGGNANGKPCAGCVGNADNKNPPGQAKDGSDHNNGYECDGNSGVGKTNPAHSGCKATTTTSTPQQQTTTTLAQQTTTTVAQQTTTTVAQQTTTTVAQQTTTTVAVAGNTTTTAEVLGVQFTQDGETPLASTGAGFMRPFTLLGALFLLVGMTLMIIRVRPVASRP
jgi:hypothetical protein